MKTQQQVEQVYPIGRTNDVNNTHNNCLQFRDDHLFPVFPSQQTPKKYIDDDYN